MKKIVICLDGTWQNPYQVKQRDDGSRVLKPSNVLKLARAVLARRSIGPPASDHLLRRRDRRRGQIPGPAERPAELRRSRARRRMGRRFREQRGRGVPLPRPQPPRGRSGLHLRVQQRGRPGARPDPFPRLVGWRSREIRRLLRAALLPPLRHDPRRRSARRGGDCRRRSSRRTDGPRRRRIPRCLGHGHGSGFALPRHHEDIDGGSGLLCVRRPGRMRQDTPVRPSLSTRRGSTSDPRCGVAPMVVRASSSAGSPAATPTSAADMSTTDSRTFRSGGC